MCVFLFWSIDFTLYSFNHKYSLHGHIYTNNVNSRAFIHGYFRLLNICRTIRNHATTIAEINFNIRWKSSVDILRFCVPSGDYIVVKVIIYQNCIIYNKINIPILNRLCGTFISQRGNDRSRTHNQKKMITEQSDWRFNLFLADFVIFANIELDNTVKIFLRILRIEIMHQVFHIKRFFHELNTFDSISIFLRNESLFVFKHYYLGFKQLFWVKLVVFLFLNVQKYISQCRISIACNEMHNIIFVISLILEKPVTFCVFILRNHSNIITYSLTNLYRLKNMSRSLEVIKTE